MKYQKKMKIIIEKVYQENNRLYCNITEGDKSYKLFFQVESPYANYLCDTRADAFLVTCLYRAAREGYDIECLVPVSERLLFQINTFMTTVLASVFGRQQIAITAPVDSTLLPSARAIGTGITCGVDSLYSIATQSIGLSKEFSHYKLTHLALFNIGSHRIGAESTEKLYTARIDLAHSFCTENGFSFVSVDSNLHEFLPYDYTEYYGIVNCAPVLALQKLFATYYSSSSYSLKDFRLSSIDVTHFEILNMAMLSTENTTFYSLGAEQTRFEKTAYLTKNYTPSYKYLNVCNTYHYNCGHCVKCLRTLLTLDILDALDKYATVFDLEDYRSHRMKYIGDAYARMVLAKDSFIQEIWPSIRNKFQPSIWHKGGGCGDSSNQGLRYIP